jgi:hypothetical protein
LAIAFSFILAEPIHKIEKEIQEFPSKLVSFFTNTIFIIFIIILFSVGLIFLIFFKYKSHREHKRIEIEKKEIRKSFSPKARKIYLKENEDKEINEKESEEDVEDEESYEPLPIGTYQKSVNIKVDSGKRYFHKKDISKDEVEYLLDEGYQIKKYKNLLNSRMEKFLLQPRHNESFTHLFLTHNISEFLEKEGIETELYTTKKPDIVFEIRGKRFAIEIETGSIFSKISRMKEKLKVLENYDKWFFVVTDRNKVKKYKRYGDAVDKRYVKPRLDKLIKLAKKAQK